MISTVKKETQLPNVFLEVSLFGRLYGGWLHPTCTRLSSNIAVDARSSHFLIGAFT